MSIYLYVKSNIYICSKIIIYVKKKKFLLVFAFVFPLKKLFKTLIIWIINMKLDIFLCIRVIKKIARSHTRAAHSRQTLRRLTKKKARRTLTRRVTHLETPIYRKVRRTCRYSASSGESPGKLA